MRGRAVELEDELLVQRYPLFDPQECSSLGDRVLSLREHWTIRAGGLFYTLGAASYLDAPSQHAAYLDCAQKSNAVLLKSFPWLYQRIVNFFSETLREPAFFGPGYTALPGFHIFLLKGYDRNQDDVSSRAHFDLQWKHALPGYDGAKTLSFTVLIEQPEGGAAMEMWKLRYSGVEAQGSSVTQFASSNPSCAVNYERGAIVVHDGYHLHAIGRAGVRAPTGRRVTIQGHGIRTDDGWLLYW